MFELMLWRARVGRFNNVIAKRTRQKCPYCKSDITVCVIATYKFCMALYSPNTLYPYRPDLTLPTNLYLTLLSILLLLGPMWSLSITTYIPNIPKLAKIIIHYIFTHLPLSLVLSGDIHPNPGPNINKNYSICHLLA